MKHVFMFSLGIVLIFLIILSMSGIAISKNNEGNLNAHLRGNYTFTLRKVCVRNMDGFGDDLELLSDASMKISTAQGIRTYNGDGTGSTIYRSNSLHSNRLSAGDVPVGAGEGTCDFTYEVNHDGSFTEEMTCTGINSSGKTTTITGIQYQGQIADGRQILLLSDTSTNIEVKDTEDSGIRYVICNRNTIAAKIHCDSSDPNLPIDSLCPEVDDDSDDDSDHDGDHDGDDD